MRANVFRSVNEFGIEDVKKPRAGAGEAVVRMTLTRIVTTLCPGGKERMRRLLEMVRRHRVDLAPLITHRFKLDDIPDAYALFSDRRDGVVKVAVRP